MKTKFWILGFAVLLVICACWALLLRGASSGHVANIYRDGVLIRSVDLERVEAPCSFLLTDEDGHENLVEVEPGRIRIASANCPDQVCVNTGWISNTVRPIVCLPAKLSIRLEETGAADHPDSGMEIDGVVG